MADHVLRDEDRDDVTRALLVQTADVVDDGVGHLTVRRVEHHERNVDVVLDPCPLEGIRLLIVEPDSDGLQL